MFRFVVLLVLSILVGGYSCADDPINFQSEIAPILRDHCLRCHNDETREGDISLVDSRDLFSNEWIGSDDPSENHFLELVVSDDGPPRMPKEGKPLTEAQIDALRRWMNQGGRWPFGVTIEQTSKADKSWWAYQPLRKTQDTSAKSIDDFIRKKLKVNGLGLSPQADRRTLIRRLSFDLHGLPPTPESVDAFVNDPNPNAYEKLVDEMLDSPRYGERYAQHWLDIAHYADTHGFERDKRRDNAWRYRDYVIEALNDDKPYDRFLREQIAGDVLWPEDSDAVIATGFLAAGPYDFVGQVETKSPILRRSARSLDLDDMATQVITATMAMTVNCARCHNHKLDPISQREYYQLRAVFAGVKRDDRVVSVSALQQYEESTRELTSQRSKIEFELARLEGDGLNLADIVGGGNGLGTGTFRNAIDPRTAKVQTRDFGNLGNVVTNRFVESQFEFIDGVFIPDGDDGKAEITVSSSGIKITGLPNTSGKAWDMIRNGPVASQHSPELDGIDFTKNGHSLIGLHANAGITFDLREMRRRLLDSKSGESRELRFITKLGYFGAEGNNFADAWIFLDGAKVFEHRKLRRVDGIQKVDFEIPDTAEFLTLVSTDGGNGYGMDQIGFGDPMIKRSELPSLSDKDRQRQKQLRQDRKNILAELDELGPPPKFYGVVAQKEMPETRLLTRGNPETPAGDSLSPAAFSTLTMLDPSLGTKTSSDSQRRAALARWITHSENPLVRRVIVNRLWQWHFGTGIVDTPSDFGFGGGRPSHPELLDWLAEEFLRCDWSLKSMHRLILNSATYKQVSKFESTHPAMQLDADNRWLWRQSPRRIDAESIRDSVLFVSGKLNEGRGGPGFEDFEYQDAYAPIYTYITADKPELWRRSIYRYVVRTTPDRFLTTLDCPDPANLTPKRLATTTPIQSLALYNNEFMLKQAKYFSERVEKESGASLELQVSRAFRLALARPPNDKEMDFATAFVKRESLFALCRTLLNLNEFVYVD